MKRSPLESHLYTSTPLRKRSILLAISRNLIRRHMTGRKKARRGEYELKQENGRQRILGTIDYQGPAQASAARPAPLARLLFEQPARVEPLPEAIDPMVRWGSLLAHPESMATFRVH